MNQEYVVYWKQGNNASPSKMHVRAASKNEAYQKAIDPWKRGNPRPQLIEVRTREEDMKLPQIR